MKRSLLLITLSFLLLPLSQACDACGCSIGGGGIGLMPAYKSNFIGLGWQMARFSGATDFASRLHDDFQVLELSARYHLNARLKLLFFQPYRINTRHFIEGSTRSIQGLSDPRIMASYTLFRDVALGEQSSLFFELGAGLKLPVGKYDPNIHANDLPENFNIGNGSLGYLLQSNLVITIQKAGIVLATNYQHNSKSRSDYQFGHQLNNQLILFWEQSLGENLQLIPNAGLQAEWIGTDHYANGMEVHGTGGKGLFANAGINLKNDTWLFGISYSQPLHSNYSNGEVSAEGRLSCQLSYLF
ncbi:MAG: hypothetical protein AAGG75_07490 [Bacteroidota bacterium]